MDRDAGMRWLDWLGRPTWTERELAEPRPSLCIVVAHPDDEVIGAGSRLPLMRSATFVHVTDGSPLNGCDARRVGCATRQEYAALRRRELEAAIAIAGIGPARLRSLGFIDQQASHQLPQVTLAVLRLIEELRPDVILTQPYEGGHPDHDATAFAVHTACAMSRHPSRVLEMTSYHAGPQGLIASEFLPPHEDEVTVALTPDQRRFKAELMRCFASQEPTLRQFPLETERFRRFREAPAYDFARPPHEGALHYEHYDWGITGERWREAAAAALDQLGVPQHA